MLPATRTMQTDLPRSASESDRALRILAKSVLRELRTSGYGHNDVVTFASELIDLVTGELRDSDTPSAE